MKLDVWVPIGMTVLMVGWGIVERLAAGQEPADQFLAAFFFAIWAVIRAGT